MISWCNKLINDKPPLGSISNNNVYLVYSNNHLSVSLDQQKNIYLFFYASWCPTCEALDNNIRENLTNIPESTIIYQVDYDTNAKLKEQYNITEPNTVVLLDNNKNARKKSTSLQTYKDIINFK
jgi:thiol-disulfide isomerase/thioredoxin